MLVVFGRGTATVPVDETTAEGVQDLVGVLGVFHRPVRQYLLQTADPGFPDPAEQFQTGGGYLDANGAPVTGVGIAQDVTVGDKFGDVAAHGRRADTYLAGEVDLPARTGRFEVDQDTDSARQQPALFGLSEGTPERPADEEEFVEYALCCAGGIPIRTPDLVQLLAVINYKFVAFANQ